MKKTLNVGLIGHKFMGKAHSHAWRDVAMFFNLDVVPVMKKVCGIEDDVPQAAEQYGWQSWTHDWKDVINDPEIHIVDICTPDSSHCELALAAAAAGKHVLCEKPLALSLAEARSMYQAVQRHKVKNMVNFTYRGVPALRLARQLIADKKIGDIYHFMGLYQQDFSLSPDFPFVWRMDKKMAGAGTMADKGSHIIDMARFLVGEIRQVACKSEIFIKQRTVPATGKKAKISNNDAAVFIGTFSNGALGLFETSNMSAGRKNALIIEISGSNGSIRFDLERMNELQVFFADDPEAVQGFRTLLVTQPSHPYIKQWWPPGHIIGWEHTFVHQVYEFLIAIAHDKPAQPGFYDGLKCQEVVEAIAAADSRHQWVTV